MTPLPQPNTLPGGVLPGGRYATWSPDVPVWVVADVDGTLVGEAPTATARVAAAVRTAAGAGLAVGFATGRLPGGVRALHGQLGLAGPHIVHNGAQVRAGGRPLRTWAFTREQADALLAWCERTDHYCELYLDDGFVVNRLDERARPHWDRIIGQPAGTVADVDLDTTRVVKGTVVLFGGDDDPAAMDGIRALGLAPGSATSPLTPGMTFLNVTDPAVDKGMALRWTAEEHLRCGLPATVAIGDGLNDLTMLEVAGTAIAMGQAPPEVREVAHLVVPEVTADGVAHALEAVAAWRSGAARR